MSTFKDEQKWTDTDRLTLWKMFVDSAASDKSIYDRIARNLNRTEKSVRTEIWKIYRVNPNSESTRADYIYWNSSVRAKVRYPDDMSGKPWTRRHDAIAMEASRSAVPAWRIAELLGRPEAEVVERIRGIEAGGRTALFPELEYGNDRKAQSEAKRPQDHV